MRFTELAARLVALVLVAPPVVADDTAAELADIAARIEYGFHAEDAQLIDAARAALERLPESVPAVLHHRAFAAFRAAQLAQSARRAETLLGECMALAGSSREHVEGAVLVAACATVAAARGLAQPRRRDQALERAKALDASNPRVALLEAWIVEVPGTPAARAAAAARLAVALERFRAWQSVSDWPEWGEAEALVRLGEIHLERGETRLARDLAERALLAATDYRAALELRRKLQKATP